MVKAIHDWTQEEYFKRALPAFFLPAFRRCAHSYAAQTKRKRSPTAARPVQADWHNHRNSAQQKSPLPCGKGLFRVFTTAEITQRCPRRWLQQQLLPDDR